MRRVLFLLAASPLVAASAFGWGCEGHQMIALIARAHLTPAASEAVDRLLRENPMDPELSRFCKDRPNDLMADSATWADDARTVEKTADWHFIDIPRAAHADTSHEKDAMKWCPPLEGEPGCIVSAIDYEWSILRDKSQSAPTRAKALRYVIHFVGDLSQPLHASDNRDRGGNCTEIGFFSQEKPENLHAIWDYKIIQRELEANKMSQARYASSLDESFPRDSRKIDILAWTWESHALASSVTYGNLRPPIPVASPAAGLADLAACNAERAAVAALDISIGDEYVSRALPVIRAQLAKGGYRLAGLLNQTFK
jgi:nuclease S1